MQDADMMAEIERLSALAKQATARRDKLFQDKSAILAERDALRRSLQKLMETAEKEGFDPENMKGDLMRKLEVERTKLEVYLADLSTSEAMAAPMLQAIRTP
jgi:hypothetical protein